MLKSMTLLRQFALIQRTDTMAQDNPVDETARNALQEASEEYGVPYDELEEKYRENYADAREQAVIELSHEDSLRPAALDRTLGGYQESRQTGVITGEPEEVPIMAIGHQGSRDDFGEGDDDIVVASGIVNPDDREDENMPAGLATFYLDADDVDRLDVREKFRFGNEILGNVAVKRQEDAFPGRSRTYYFAGSDEDTFFESADFDGWPDDLAGKRNLVNQHIVPESDKVQLDALDQSLSQEADGTFGFWYDLKRIEGQVVDAYKDTEKDFGIYKVIAEPYGDPDELRDTPLYSDEDAENDRTPGLQIWASPEQVRNREGARIEVYGLLEADPDSGHITMTGVGVVDLLPKPYDEDGGDSNESDNRETEAL